MALLASSISFRRTASLSSEANWTWQNFRCSLRALIVISRVAGSKGALHCPRVRDSERTVYVAPRIRVMAESPIPDASDSSGKRDRCTLQASRKGCSQLGFGDFTNLLPGGEAIGDNAVHLPRLGIFNPSQSRESESRYGQDFFAAFNDGKRVQIHGLMLTESIYLVVRKLSVDNRRTSGTVQEFHTWTFLYRSISHGLH